MRNSLRAEIDELDALAERLADAAIDLLAQGIDGDSSAVRLEREVQRARRSVLKAAEILRSLSGEQRD